jgi:hypothetical protein
MRKRDAMAASIPVGAALSAMSVRSLQQRAKALGIPYSGKRKDALIRDIRAANAKATSKARSAQQVYQRPCKGLPRERCTSPCTFTKRGCVAARGKRDAALAARAATLQRAIRRRQAPAFPVLERNDDSARRATAATALQRAIRRRQAPTFPVLERNPGDDDPNLVLESNDEPDPFDDWRKKATDPFDDWRQGRAKAATTKTKAATAIQAAARALSPRRALAAARRRFVDAGARARTQARLRAAEASARVTEAEERARVLAATRLQGAVRAQQRRQQRRQVDPFPVVRKGQARLRAAEASARVEEAEERARVRAATMAERKAAIAAAMAKQDKAIAKIAEVRARRAQRKAAAMRLAEAKRGKRQAAERKRAEAERAAAATQIAAGVRGRAARGQAAAARQVAAARTAASTSSAAAQIIRDLDQLRQPELRALCNQTTPINYKAMLKDPKRNAFIRGSNQKNCQTLKKESLLKAFRLLLEANPGMVIKFNGNAYR